MLKYVIKSIKEKQPRIDKAMRKITAMLKRENRERHDDKEEDRKRWMICFKNLKQQLTVDIVYTRFVLLDGYSNQLHVQSVDTDLII